MTQPSFNRPGAVDLSQLAKPGGGGSGSGGAGGSYVIEVTEQSFDAEVIRKSVKHPIVVEFYSPRVSTGEQLSATLAAAANEAAGKYLVARLNVDTSPQIVQAIGLQAVPTVVGVIGGQIAPLFQGVLPAEQVKAYLDELIKAAVTNGIVGRAEPVGGTEAEDPDAEQAPDPRFAAADAALEQGDFATARDEFDKLLQANPNDVEASAGKAQAGLLARSTLLNADEVMAKVASPGAPVEAELDAADVEIASGQPEAAFTRLLNVIRTRPADREPARVRLLELFETLGNADPRVLKARRDLMSALF